LGYKLLIPLKISNTSSKFLWPSKVFVTFAKLAKVTFVVVNYQKYTLWHRFRIVWINGRYKI